MGSVEHLDLADESGNYNGRSEKQFGARVAFLLFRNIFCLSLCEGDTICPINARRGSMTYSKG